MRFSLRERHVCFHDSEPRSYVGMRDPHGRTCVLDDGESKFDDRKRDYTWAFSSFSDTLQDGDQFVFTAESFKAVGEIKAGQIEIVPEERPVRVCETTRPPSLISLGKLSSRAPSTKVRCLFVNPSVPYGQWKCYRQGAMNEASFSAHGAAYVSATLKAAGHVCWMVDLRGLSNWAHVEETLRGQDYDVAFVGFLSIDVFNAAAVVRLLKEVHPDRPVVVGGLHVSIAKEREFPRADLIERYCFNNYGIVPDVFKQFLAWKGERVYDPRRFPLADYVILDDGEIAARDLVAELAAGRLPTERTIEGGAVPMEVARHLDRDLFDLGTEAYSPILPFQPTPMATVTWARGCPFHCRYCNLASQLSNTNVRQKPVELVEEELDSLYRRLGNRISSLMIHDDLTFDIQHIAQWCELILRKYGGISLWMQTRADWVVTRYRKNREFWDLLCRAGLTWVSVGYESGSQRMLDYMRKDNTVEKNVECARILDEAGINSFANLLWGCPTETHEEAEATVTLARTIRPGFLSGSVYCNYVGTQLAAECEEKGHLVRGEVYARSHLPWQVRIRGIDYAHVYDCLRRAGEASNYLRMPKMIPEQMKRELAASSRGLPIH